MKATGQLDRVSLPSRPALDQAPRTRWWRELALVAILYFGYDLVRRLIAGSTPLAERDGGDLLHWEQLVHLDPEHWLNSGLGHLPWLAVPACFAYASLHFLVTPAVLVWMYRARARDYPQARTVIALLTASALIGFWLFPTAPPRLLTGAGFQDTLAAFSNWGWWGGGTNVPLGAAALANQYAAMPSLHCAWAIWCGVTVYRFARRRWVRALGLLYPVLTALVVLATANHYLLDVVAGFALWLAADGLVRVQVQRRGGGPGLVPARRLVSRRLGYERLASRLRRPARLSASPADPGALPDRAGRRC